MNHVVRAVVGILADDEPRNTGPDFGKASPFGLLVIVLLLLGTILLVWSMNRQLKKIPASFDQEPTSDQAGGPPSDGDGDQHGGDAGRDGSLPDAGP
ncbi:MAG TPA: hypothetical protein VFQ37_02625 [Mycobacterium sp.]|nr:hypothetical protein [Mycobacterium sp.]